MSQVDLTKITTPFGLLDPETQEALRSKYNGIVYDEKSKSCLRWEIGRGTARSGSEAGSLKTDGYYKICLRKRDYLAHRVVFELHYGMIDDGVYVDHINGDKRDNRIENLRLADNAQNQHNSKIRSDSKTGIKGLSWRVRDQVWVAQVKFRGKNYYKQSSDKEICLSFLEDMREKHHGDFARAS